jgi:hypothetical protein
VTIVPDEWLSQTEPGLSLTSAFSLPINRLKSTA